MYHTLEDARAKIKISELNELKMKTGEWETSGMPGAKCMYKNNILKFEVDDKLPVLRKHTENIRNLWISRIVYAYEQLGVNVYYEKAFCLIKVSNKWTTYWDVDNLAYKYIIDAIRGLAIVKDDNFRNITLCVTGEKKNYNRTEIMMFDHAYFEQFLKSFVC